MNTAVLVANIVGWPIFQISIARASLYWPESHFVSRSIPSRSQLLEISFYNRVLRIRLWKHLLPDGAPWLGGKFSKSRLKSRNTDYLRRFAVESRRGEVAHWCMLFCFPIFYLWNPLWASAVMTFYAFATNLPCIIVQRYNRFVILRCLQRNSAD